MRKLLSDIERVKKRERRNGKNERRRLFSPLRFSVSFFFSTPLGVCLDQNANRGIWSASLVSLLDLYKMDFGLRKEKSIISNFPRERRR